MYGKLNALAKRCRNRGGDCPCLGDCRAAREVTNELSRVATEGRELNERKRILDDIAKRINTPPATLKPDFVFDPNLTPVIYFDGDEAVFGYEDDNGDWFEQSIWPFNEETVWPDDCERLGFTVV